MRRCLIVCVLFGSLSAARVHASPAQQADRVWGAEAMADSRAKLHHEHGGGTRAAAQLYLADWQVRDGEDAYRWDAEASWGGDIHRVVLKSEGVGSSGGGVDDAELQALYRRALGPYFNSLVGVRHDFRPRPSLDYATVGIEGLAPFWMHVEGLLFVSEDGDALARIEGWHDLRITQRLILQPRLEMNAAADDMPEIGLASGMTDFEFGLRLRYELRREFAPYLGVSWDRKTGDTGDLARAAGEDPAHTSVVFGIRAWF